METKKFKEVMNAVKILAALSEEEWEEISRNLLIKKSAAKIVAIRNKKYGENLIQIMGELRFSPKLKGYHYLRSAIMYYIIAEEPCRISLTKELYPAIAKEFETTYPRVERAIRHAIGDICKMPNNQKLHELFGDLNKYKNGKPTNGEVIATVAQYLQIMH